MSTSIPLLYVEGPDDIVVINSLLKHHGVDTKGGNQHLTIKAQGNDDKVLTNMVESLKSATDKPVGFVLDIDATASSRWDQVCSRLRLVGVIPPRDCPEDGFIGNLPDYKYDFGIWLMPDCKTDGERLEDFCITLIPECPLWAPAKEVTKKAAEIADEYNGKLLPGARKCKRFKPIHHTKACLHTWLAWQNEPGSALGAAINGFILAHDSPHATAFLKWLRKLYGFPQLVV
jgi:hypothetical protein